MELVNQLLEKYPMLVSALAVMGGLRVVFKPVFSFLRLLADQTPSTKDNVLLDKVESSKISKGIVWLVDYLTSVKLPEKK